MSRIVFCLLIVAAVLSTVWAGLPQRCGKHEEYVECGPACPPACHPLRRPQACISTRQCVRGCQCKLGYLRNYQNKCVLPHECEGQDHYILF